MKWTAILLLSVTALSLMSARSNAGVIFQDNFNSENGGFGQLNYSAFTNWNVARGSIDLIGNGFVDFFPSHGLYVDLDGSTFAAGKLVSNQTFAPGSYQLSFDLAGSQRGDTNTVTVSLGGWSEDFTLPSDAPFATITRSVTTAGGSLIFDHAGGDNLGLLLDNVQVSTAAQTPEPSSVVLLGLGLLGLAGCARRRRRGTQRG